MVTSTLDKPKAVSLEDLDQNQILSTDYTTLVRLILKNLIDFNSHSVTINQGPHQTVELCFSDQTGAKLHQRYLIYFNHGVLLTHLVNILRLPDDLNTKGVKGIVEIDGKRRILTVMISDRSCCMTIFSERCRFVKRL